MHLHDILRTQLAIAQKRFGELTIVETGTIRSTEPIYADDDGWSTLCFAQWIAEHGGFLDSIDLETDAAAKVLADRGLGGPVMLCKGHSLDVLTQRLADAHADPNDHSFDIHIAYLDSDNDADLILNEYKLVTQMMPPGAILMVDDVDLSPGAQAKKGHAIVPWLEKHKQDYSIVGRHGKGYSTGVLITVMP